MYRRVLHHTYANGRATDVSANGNHGVPTATSAGTGPFASSLWFNGHDARVDVPPSPDLADLRGMRVRVRFRMPGHSLWWWWAFRIPLLFRWWPFWSRRHNLVEGHLSFALFVQPDGSIRGTILDADGAWRGPVTPRGVVKPGQWHTVEFGHDGVVSAAIAVDGVTLATAHDLIGPVRGVGPRGVTVGHWPEPPHVYTLLGWIDEVELWREEPDPEMVDDCCGDPEVVDRAVDELREQRWDHSRAKQVLARLERFEADLRIAVTGGDPARMAEVELLAARGSSAIARRDAVAAVSALGGTLQLFADRLSAAQQQAFLTEAKDLVGELPFSQRLREALDGDLASRAWLTELAKAMCLPVPQDGEPPRDQKAERERVPRHLGDPYTDRPDDGDDRPPGDPHGRITGWKPSREDRERHEASRREWEERAVREEDARRRERDEEDEEKAAEREPDEHEEPDEPST